MITEPKLAKLHEMQRERHELDLRIKAEELRLVQSGLKQRVDGLRNRIAERERDLEVELARADDFQKTIFAQLKGEDWAARMNALEFLARKAGPVRDIPIPGQPLEQGPSDWLTADLFWEIQGLKDQLLKLVELEEKYHAVAS